MSPEAEALFNEAAELPVSERPAFLAARCADPSERAEILSLLEHDGLAEPLFDPAIEVAVADIARDPEPGPGDRAGAWEIDELIGRGGMGAVHKAHRADGAYTQIAALKFPALGFGLWSSDRFLEERRILARLVHPNIARLLDAGETDAGRPFLVLEYIDGEPVDQYCQHRRLGTREIVTLFLGVLDGVAHAHRNLVVHRDIKPGNILVDRTGVARVVDFGIAKVLEAAAPGTENPTTRLLTPEYASPEQISGDPVTTASDVFSMGAVLHRLLAGTLPRDLTGASPLESLRRLAQNEARVAEDLPPELRSILSKSMRLDPGSRYASASEFRADLQRYLDGLPVEAAPEARFYVARKLMWRHRGVIAIACAVVAAITASAAVAIVQARRAERRAAEVRQLASRFLFEFEESIRTLPGATRPRQLVVETASGYLARLASDTRGDRGLVLELAESYRKLGEIQGSLAAASSVDSKAALTSVRQAHQLMESARIAGSKDEAEVFRYLDCLYDLMVLERAAGQPERLAELLPRALVTADSWAETAVSPDLLGGIAAIYSQHAGQLSAQARGDEARAAARKSLRARERAAALRPGDRKVRRGVAVGHWAIASILSDQGDRGGASTEWREAVRILDQLLQEEPGNAQLAREHLAAAWQLGVESKRDLLDRHQDLGPALDALRSARDRAKLLAARDAGNALLRSDEASIHLAYGAALVQAKRYRDAFPVLEDAVERAGALVKQGKGGRHVESTQAVAIGWMAQAHFESGNAARALDLYQNQGAIFNRLASADPASLAYRREQAANLLHIGMAQARLGNPGAARISYARGLGIARSLPDGKALMDKQSLVKDLEAAQAALKISPGSR